MLVYYTRAVPPASASEFSTLNLGNLGMALFSGATFMLGALFSAFSG